MRTPHEPAHVPEPQALPIVGREGNGGRTVTQGPRDGPACGDPVGEGGDDRIVVHPKVLERAYLDGDVDALRAAFRSAFRDDLSVVLRLESALREIGREGTNTTALKEATYIVKMGKEPEEYI